jgi:HEAT repeat protein
VLRALRQLGETVPASVFVKALEDSDPGIRGSAVQGLQTAVGDAFLGTYSKMMFHDPDDSVRARAAVAYGRCQDPGSWEALRRLHDREPQSAVIRFGAIAAMAWLEDMPPGATDFMVKALESETSPTVQLALLVAVSRQGTAAQQALPRVIQLMQEGENVVRASAVRAIPHLGGSTPEMGKIIARALEDQDSRVRDAALRTLMAMGQETLRAVRDDLVSASSDTTASIWRQVDVAMQWLVDDECEAEAGGERGGGGRENQLDCLGGGP